MGDLVVLQPDTQLQVPAQPNRGGRPTLYSEPVAERICDTLARGVTRQAAALEAGIDRDTFYDWLLTRDGFSDRVARAEAKAEVKLTETVFSSGTDGETAGDWRPAIEWLKRRRRADYGDTLDVRKLDDETILRMIAAAQQDNQAVTEEGTPARISGADDI